MGIRVGPNYRSLEPNPFVLVDPLTGLPAALTVAPPEGGALETTQEAVRTAVEAVATATASTATINVGQDVSALKFGANDLTPKFAPITASALGDNPIVAAVAGKKILVLAYTAMAKTAVDAKWRSGTTDISGLLYPGANGGASPGFCPVGHFETAAGSALNLNLASAALVGGHIVYVEV